MPNYANYDVVSDGITLIDAAQDPDKDFPLGFDPSINVGIRSVLSYMVDPGSPGVTFKMSIVNFDIPDSAQQITTPVVASTQLPSLSPHVRQEIIDANVFKKIGNTLRVQVTAGRANFSDIVIMYKSSSAL
ncbi:hypothetical protein [Candidatus Nitrotoga arctica]|uniref:Uncharacterized protein n=1 Tax=Candidatus Nitrotoga arctica TaxID=453162 RepID=A0ABN8AM56_9PROT|nr:hypothetical protein [Candidatus Nitrotoga arctica]CAG9931823.1 protein of unknown function [Candidatus Nitrotoga arctica]